MALSYTYDSTPHFERRNVFRWYETGTGRYTRPDPLGEAGITETAFAPRPLDRDQFSPLYAYVGNNPVVYVDPLGLLRFVGCSQGQQSSISQAFKGYCGRIDGPSFADCICDSPSIPGRLQRLCGNPRLVVQCRPESSLGCGNCAWSIPYGRTVRLCPTAFMPGKCGPLGCTVLHEMTHLLGYRGEEKPRRVEKCLGCP